MDELTEYERREPELITDGVVWGAVVILVLAGVGLWTVGRGLWALFH